MVKIVLRSLMWLYMLVLLAVWGCLYFDTGNSWWTTLFLFSPRWVLGLPWLLLFPLTLLVDYRIARWYAIHLIVLVIPLLGFCVPSFSFDERANEAVPRLRVMTCNLGEGPIRVGQLLLWLEQERSEVLLLQECNSQLLEELKQKLDWNFRHDDKLVIASSRRLSDITIVEQRDSDHYGVSVMISAEVSLSNELATTHQYQLASQEDPKARANSVRLVCVHFPTFRPAFEKARSFDASAEDDYRMLVVEYRSLAKAASEALLASETPTLIGGDFNVPAESAFYRDYWSDYQNALSIQGWGLCYTKYTRLHGVRIDHVLGDAHWTVESAKVGPNLGGDHRPVSVGFGLVASPAAAKLTP